MIRIINPGSHGCIVDGGRYGYRSLGIPTGGAMDTTSYILGQSIVGNSFKNASLELYQGGQVLHFEKKATIAITGAKGDFVIDNQKVQSNIAVSIMAGSILSIGKLKSGCRVYISIQGGLETIEYLQSQSPLIGYDYKSIKKGETINHRIGKDIISSSSHARPLTIDYSVALKCYPGPEWYSLSDDQKNDFLSSSYKISTQSNRQGYRLSSSHSLLEGTSSIITSPTIPGTIQLPPDGNPIILMRDGQTTGGYPRIAVLTEMSINQLAQRPPGQSVRLKIKSY